MKIGVGRGVTPVAVMRHRQFSIVRQTSLKLKVAASCNSSRIAVALTRVAAYHPADLSCVLSLAQLDNTLACFDSLSTKRRNR